MSSKANGRSRKLSSAANAAVDGGEPTVLSVIEAFLAHSIKKDSPRTYDERKRYLQMFAEAHGKKLIKECKAYHLSSWMDNHAQWSNPWTHSYVVRCIKRPFNWAVDEDLIPKNPFRKVKHFSGDPRRPITDDEFKRLLTAAGKNERVAEVFRFLYLTGCRPGELWNLRWSNIHWQRKLIVLEEHKTRHTQRTPKPRVFSFNDPEAVKVLEGIRDRKDQR